MAFLMAISLAYVLLPFDILPGETFFFRLFVGSLMDTISFWSCLYFLYNVQVVIRPLVHGFILLSVFRCQYPLSLKDFSASVLFLFLRMTKSLDFLWSVCSSFVSHCAYGAKIRGKRRRKKFIIQGWEEKHGRRAYYSLAIHGREFFTFPSLGNNVP